MIFILSLTVFKTEYHYLQRKQLQFLMLMTAKQFLAGLGQHPGELIFVCGHIFTH